MKIFFFFEEFFLKRKYIIRWSDMQRRKKKKRKLKLRNMWDDLIILGKVTRDGLTEKGGILEVKA